MEFIVIVLLQTHLPLVCYSPVSSSLIPLHMYICFLPLLTSPTHPSPSPLFPPLPTSHTLSPPHPSPLPPLTPHPPPPPDMALKEHVTSLTLKKKVPHKASSRRARKQRRQLSSGPWEASEATLPSSRAQHSRKPSVASAGGPGVSPAAENTMDPGI